MGSSSCFGGFAFAWRIIPKAFRIKAPLESWNYQTPTYILYHGKATGKDKDGKKIWTRIGAVWPNKSGRGFHIAWDYLPLGDGVTVMLPYAKHEQDTHLVPDEYPA